jgi:ABC-type nitrate/sulfonate/bicarbonate transport system permease component
MSLPIRHHLIRGALVAFLAADLLGLAALLYDQLFSVEAPYIWVLSAVPVVAALPLLVRLADHVMLLAKDDPMVRFPGEKIP